MDRRCAALLSLLALAFIAVAFSEVSGAVSGLRAKRETPVAADLKDTPCAPNDYFKIDCNTCYCNIERSGYLCTENICGETTSFNPFGSSTQGSTQIPLANDSMLVITPEGAQVVSNFSLRHEDGNTAVNTALTPQLATTTDTDNELNLFGRFSRDGRAQAEPASAASDISNGTTVSEAATSTTEIVSSSSTE